MLKQHASGFNANFILESCDQPEKNKPISHVNVVYYIV